MAQLSRDVLHEQLDALTGFADGKRSTLRIIVHALIDLGRVTELRCQWDGCRQPSKEFLRSDTPTDRVTEDRAPGKMQPHNMTMSVDHVEPFSAGGSDRPDNLRLVHLICNIQMGRRLTAPRWSDESRQSVSESSKARWKDPAFRAQISANTSRAAKARWQSMTEEERAAANAKVSEGLKRAWARRRAAAATMEDA